MAVLRRRTVSGNILRDKAFDIARNPKYDRYQGGPISMVCKLFDKTSKDIDRSVTCADKSNASCAINSKIMLSKQLANELNKPIISKFKNRSLYSSYKDSANIQLLSK